MIYISKRKVAATLETLESKPPRESCHEIESK